MAAAVSMFLWAASMILVRGLREDIPPIGLSFWRMFVGLLIVLPFATKALGAQTHLILRHWKILALLAVLFQVTGNALLFVSLQFTYAINAGLMNSFEPVMIIVVAWLLFRDPITRRQAFGVAVSLFGVLVLISQGEASALAALEFNKGDLFVLGVYLSWSFYAVLLRRAPRELRPEVTLCVLLALGCVFLIPFYLIEHFLFGPIQFDWPTVLSIVGLAALSSVGAVFLWNYGQ